MPRRSRQASERECPANTQRTSPCIPSRPPSIHRFLNVSCDPRQLKALAVPPIRNQLPLQPGSSTRARERDSFVHPIVCLCPALHGHGRRIGAFSHRSRTLISAPVGRQPCTALPAGMKEHKNPNQFRQVRRIPRRVMRKDRNAHTHAPPLDQIVHGEADDSPSRCDGGVNDQGWGRAEKTDSQPSEPALPCQLTDGRAALSQPGGRGAVRPR